MKQNVVSRTKITNFTRIKSKMADWSLFLIFFIISEFLLPVFLIFHIAITYHLGIFVTFLGMKMSR